METITTVERLIKTYSGIYHQNKGVFSDALLKERQEAISVFESKGVPGRSDERYKYLDLNPWFDHAYGYTIQPEKLNINSEHVFQCDVPRFDMHEIITINGFFHSHTKPHELPSGVWIGSLAKALQEIPDKVIPYLDVDVNLTDSLASLNKAVFRDGIFIYLPKNCKLHSSIQIINLQLAQDDMFVSPRNIIVLEENSSLNLVICDHTLSPNKFLSNQLTEVVVKDGAQLDVTNMQNIHNNAGAINHTNILQKANSRVNYTVLSLHGGMIRNNIAVKLDGEGADNSTNGLYMTDGSQTIDFNVLIEHAKPNCTSNQLIKGILDDTSVGTFNGKIMVAKDAQKTAAFQKCNNLLLKDTAKVNTRPQLEIYADDVKCSHGATVGQIDPDALFYLRARGISKGEARMLLMFAFAHEIVQNIKFENLRFRIDEIVNKRLRKELTRCHNCQAL